MDIERLFEAARTGNIEVLQDLLAKNPLILVDVTLSSSTESPLHVAVKAGQLDFVREIIKHKPEFAKEMNTDGYRPLDIAAITGHIDIIKQLQQVDSQICRLQGKDQRTALHYAAANGRIDIIDELISTCPNSIADVTIHGETALHLAVKNHQFPAFRDLVKWLENLNERTVINFRDRDGNTVLHLACARRQYNSLQLLVGRDNVFSGVLEVNARNSMNLTAMDILDTVMEEPNDIHIRKILQNARYDLTEEPLKDWFKYFKFQLKRDSPSDARNALLVVAALIASVTFQAGVNPPNSLLQNSKSNSEPTTCRMAAPTPEPTMGPLVPTASIAFFALLGRISTLSLFLFGNSFGLTASLSIIIYLTARFPFQRELLMAVFSMMFAYGCSAYSLAKKHDAASTLVTIAFILPFALRWLPIWLNKAWKCLKGSQQASLT